MGTVGPAEILVILVIALIVLGPNRLPEAARQVGRFVAEVRRIGAGFQAELRDAINVPVIDPSATVRSAPPAPGAPPGPSEGVEVAQPPPPPAHPEQPHDQLP